MHSVEIFFFKINLIEANKIINLSKSRHSDLFFHQLSQNRPIIYKFSVSPYHLLYNCNCLMSAYNYHNINPYPIQNCSIIETLDIKLVLSGLKLITILLNFLYKWRQTRYINRDRVKYEKKSIINNFKKSLIFARIFSCRVAFVYYWFLNLKSSA